MIIEVRVRMFFTSDEADVAPESTALVTPQTNSDWQGFMRTMIGHVAESVAGMPATNLRPMTEAEIDAYRESEGED